MKTIYTLLIAFLLIQTNAKAQTWSELGGSNALAANSFIDRVITDAAGNVYTAGEFTNGATVSSGNLYVAKWNGSTWSELGGLNALAANNYIKTLCTDAAGSFTNSSGGHYVAKWNGTAWSELGGLNALAANNPIYYIYCDAAGNIYMQEAILPTQAAIGT